MRPEFCFRGHAQDDAVQPGAPAPQATRPARAARRRRGRAIVSRLPTVAHRRARAKRQDTGIATSSSPRTLPIPRSEPRRIAATNSRRRIDRDARGTADHRSRPWRRIHPVRLNQLEALATTGGTDSSAAPIAAAPSNSTSSPRSVQPLTCARALRRRSTKARSARPSTC